MSQSLSKALLGLSKQHEVKDSGKCSFPLLNPFRIITSGFSNNFSKRIIQMQKILKFLNENDLSMGKNFSKLENYLVTYFDNW